MHEAKIDARYARTKRSLRETLKAQPERVALLDTSAFNNISGPVTALPAGEYAIVGPHAQDRRWYARLTKATDGTIQLH